MPFKLYLTSLWEWVASTGLSLATLICIALLIPRIGRLVVRWATIKINEHEERRGEIVDTEGYKGRLAILGAAVYIAEAIAFFVVGIRILKDFGFSTTGAAVPATVVSAAVAFGAQKIIADFLAGFFIITERQYGIGDSVILQNSSAPVEGTVTAITLRSTTVRTGSGQEAIVPNSVPLVAVNASSGWAKALIDIPVPLTAGTNTEELNKLFDDCVKRTLARPEIARLVSSEPDAVSILPALDLIPPTSAGVPWSIKYRVLIRVEPGEQWTVERALRSAILDKMWASYSQSTIKGLTGVARSSAETQHLHHRSDGPQNSTSPDRGSTNGTDTIQALDTTHQWATTRHHDEDDCEEQVSHTSTPAAQGTPLEHEPDDSDSATVVFPSASDATSATQVFSTEDHTEASETTTSLEAEDTRTALEKEADDAQENGLFRKISYERKIQRLFSIGGRCRASTTAIVLFLIVLVILRGLTYDGGDRGSGILAPSSLQSHSDKNESDDKSTTSAPSTAESHSNSESPTTERDRNNSQNTSAPTTTTNRTEPTTTATNTENNGEQRNSTDGGQSSDNDGSTGSDTTGEDSNSGGDSQQNTDANN